MSGAVADCRKAKRNSRPAPGRRAQPGRVADHGRSGADKIPGQSGEPGGQARRAPGGAPEGELDFLHPLPVELLWGVGPVTAGKLHEAGISLVGDVARLSERSLVLRVGLAAGTISLLWRTIAIRARSSSGAGGVRSGRNERWEGGRKPGRTSSRP